MKTLSHILSLVVLTIFSCQILSAAMIAGTGGEKTAEEQFQASSQATKQPPTRRTVVAYVTSWSTEIPDPTYITHINYAFGHVSDTFDGLRIDNVERLKTIVALKDEFPELKVLLSVGGWGSGRFSEMAADKKLRKHFAASCRKAVQEFGLDGIDIDWEYPTISSAGISSSPDDTHNFTLLIKDLRKAIGKDKLLTMATVADAQYIDFPTIIPYADFVNIMAYDMASAPKHHSPLYRSDITNGSSDEAVKAHLAAGVPASKLVLGMPLYGRAVKEMGNFNDYRDIINYEGYTLCWDSTACAPYFTDTQGNMVCGFDSPRSLEIKCRYILDQGLRGGMYWDYSGDTPSGILRRTIFETLNGWNVLQKTDKGHDIKDNNTASRPADEPSSYPADYAKAPRFKALIYYTDQAEEAHVQFALQGVEFFHRLNYGDGFVLDVATDFSQYPYSRLKQYDIVIMLNATPSDSASRATFERYMENGGGWLGFHSAAYNDSNTNWPWLVQFLGGGAFYCNNWPPQPVKLTTDTPFHPVTKNIPSSFIAPESEWYQWSPSPRQNPTVEVLLTLSPDNYPLGIKDIVRWGDFPVVWTNHHYRMIYLNMGHGDTEFTDATQNLLFVNAFRWILSEAGKL